MRPIVWSRGGLLVAFFAAACGGGAAAPAGRSVATPVDSHTAAAPAGEPRGAGPDERAYAPYPVGSDVRLLSRAGEDVDVGAHLAPGRVTVVDFSAPWCGGCKFLQYKLADLVRTHRRTLAVRIVDLGTDDGTAVFERYMEGVEALPYVQVYDQGGRLVRRLSGDETRALPGLIESLVAGPARRAP